MNMPGFTAEVSVYRAAKQYLLAVAPSIARETVAPQTLDDPWPPGQSCYTMCRSGGGTFWQCWYYCGFQRNP